MNPKSNRIAGNLFIAALPAAGMTFTARAQTGACTLSSARRVSPA